MVSTLLLSAILMGLAGTPHCLAMCGAACGAMAGRQNRVPWAFHLGRLVSYSAAGAVAAASVGSLAALGQSVGALRPLWTLVQVSALALGLFLLWRGRQPAWMEGLGRARAAEVAHRGGRWQVVRGPAQHAATGLAWVAWPCGLLQSALLVAALANGPAQGALVMAGFALASAAGLVLGPSLWWRLAGFRSGAGAGAAAGSAPAAPWLSATLAVRLAGLALAGSAAWAMGHGLWMRAVAWCFG